MTNTQHDKLIRWATPIIESFIDKQTGKFFIRGEAIHSIVTRNGVKYAAEELSKSAHTLKNKPLLKDHKNSVDSIVGRTTETAFNQTTGAVHFDAFVKDKKLQEDITDGLVTSVSVGAMVKTLEEGFDENGDKQPFVTARGIDFVELSFVAVPADPNAGFAKACFEALHTASDSFPTSINTAPSTTPSMMVSSGAVSISPPFITFTSTTNTTQHVTPKTEKKEAEKMPETQVQEKSVPDPMAALTTQMQELAKQLGALNAKVDETAKPKQEDKPATPKGIAADVAQKAESKIEGDRFVIESLDGAKGFAFYAKNYAGTKRYARVM